ncbi:BrnA antitoxin family protein [Methylobacterium mesophilicum SR1.6/6]|uniref:BrnA antitoxin family protein n=1 Tax=Methylobacterium mesophilicum SR1.6/6 TaxID=908290 RepID=A0A6B9FPA9_9HYPH|nr:BrnA antitoxin family protein [Methylobacterium mesophilicum]QGY04463.1 BrnA antitoxin family protein [Methylobacterium mesophilicum SR1.6/6]
MKPSDHVSDVGADASYSLEDWEEVSDTPALTAEQLAGMRLGPEGLPSDLAAALAARADRVKSGSHGIPVSLHVDPDVLAAYKAAGPGWEARMNEALAKGAPRRPARAKALKRG